MVWDVGLFSCWQVFVRDRSLQGMEMQRLIQMYDSEEYPANKIFLYTLARVYPDGSLQTDM